MFQNTAHGSGCVGYKDVTPNGVKSNGVGKVISLLVSFRGSFLFVWTNKTIQWNEVRTTSR